MGINVCNLVGIRGKFSEYAFTLNISEKLMYIGLNSNLFFVYNFFVVS